MLSLPNLLWFVTVGSISIFLITFILYGIFLIFFAFKKSNQSSIFDEFYNPTVSIILPTFNENKFIEKKVKNIFETNYDKNQIELIIADDSTERASIDIIDKLIEKSSQIRLSRAKERRGYCRALKDAIHISKGEIIILTDCGSLYNKKTIIELVQPLRNKNVGGVTGVANILNKDEVSGKSETLYRKIYNFMRQSESVADSTFHFHGEASSVKRELLSELPTFDNLDIAIAFHIRKQGFKVICNPEARFFEYAPNTFDGRHKQKLSRAIGVEKVIWGNKRMFSYKYGVFGLIIYPAHFLMMFICPYSAAVGGISSFAYLIATFGESWFLSVVIASILTITLLLKKELIINIIQLEIVLLIASWKIISDRKEIVFIDKIESTRR